jgi:NAD(P)-dependent dehydrogenase (short-subunit alcohol dehydrogenase family)
MTVVVTGSASGIGAALCAMLPCTIVGIDRADGPGQIGCNLADPDAIGATAMTVPGPITGIAHVAGLPGTHDAATIYAVNTLAPMALTDHLLPRLGEGGSIVAVSSITALRCDWSAADLDALLALPRAEALTRVADMEGARAYELSKAAVNRWVVKLAASLIPRGIRVNTVSPGPVQTPILVDFKTSIGEARMAAAEAMVGRHGEPEEIAVAIAFLLGRDAGWINGTDIKVDGGYHAVRAASGG